MSVEEEDYPPASPNGSQSLISEVHDVSSRVVPEYNKSKQETDLPPRYQQYSTVHSYPNYGFSIMPSMAGSQVLPTEGTKSQTHDVSHLPGFVVSPHTHAHIHAHGLIFISLDYRILCYYIHLCFPFWNIMLTSCTGPATC